MRITTITPNHTMSTPAACSAGTRIGIVVTIMDKASMKVPSRR